MTSDLIFQVMWFGAGVGGTGALWYLLSQRKYHAAVWTGFATVVVVLLAVALYIRNNLLLSQRNYYAEVWTGFATVVVVLLVVALYIRNHLLRSEQQTATANPNPAPEQPTSANLSAEVTPVANETLAQEPRVYLREQSANEVAARIGSLKPLEQELFANQTYVGRWVRWSGEITSIRPSASFLKGGAFTVMVGDYIFGHTNASLELLSTERHLVEPLEEGDWISYEAKITIAFSTAVYLSQVTFMQPEERSVVDITPEYLMRFFEGRTDIQARMGVADYIGKWMKVSGPLGNIGDSKTNRQVTFADRSPTHMFFHKKRWVDRLSILSPGENITVLGRITYVERGNLVLYSCEFIDY